MKIGYLGPEGSYSYTAAKCYAPQGTLISMRGFREIIQGVENGTIEEGILPIENSTEGAVTQTMDALMETVDSKIKGELVLQIRHNLLSLGESIGEINYVASHPQALEQCREFLATHYPHAVLIPSESSSAACQMIKEKDQASAYAAIANSWAGENNGLKTLCKDIQDNKNNQTRFIIIGIEDTITTGNDKTSIAFSFHEDYPGSLYGILREFAQEKINLTRVESRPAKAELGKYIFYIDFNGHGEDQKCKSVLERIRKEVNKFKIFGSYPIGRVY
ncbi:Prephenate dehydratase [Alkaliphilus metalliredigens QYMF]|uniref:Prephenate dehydratase n=1 Tax=Alkaliphilus metalliredigens (strain QYMF) TaxID=293826 RepID=A6TL05_ALKMQ|nr:prephenate dehydratase [Alkaliphilus metalliredigens]ABR46873.1 Prephenate dehydratase [Alkaliphilus metalliredigens QYMF]